MRRVKSAPYLFALLLFAAGCGSDASTSAGSAPTAAPATTPDAAGRFGNPSEVAADFEVPWALAFLPSGEALVTERQGRLNVLAADDRSQRRTIDVPGVVPAGEGGLLGVAVSPEYAQDSRIFLYMTTADDNRIVSFRLENGALADRRDVLTGITKANTHNGGRIAFGPDGYLYAGTGDAQNRSASQDRNDLNGKILRMTTDGAPAPGNPFGTVVYSYGHRNVQGLAWDESNRFYATEFGQNTTDELNRIEPGRNYGWPTIEGEGDTRDGAFTNPIATWSTSEASPSGLVFVEENDQPVLYMAALRGQRLWRIPLDGNGGAGPSEAILRGDFGRLRAAVVAPDDSLWVTTSNDSRYGAERGDKIVRLTR